MSQPSSILIFLFLLISIANGRRNNQHHRETTEVKPISPVESCDSEGEDCGQCTDQDCSFVVPNHNQFQYSLTQLCGRVIDSALPNPHGAKLSVMVCGRGSMRCGGNGDKSIRGCITVPGVKPTVTGRGDITHVESISIPSNGVKITFSNGDKCEVNGHPRHTTLTLPCDPSRDLDNEELKGLINAYEGTKKDICHYYVTFPASKLGCPVYPWKSFVDSAHHPVIITAVRGCVDSDPPGTTSSCPLTGGQTLTIYTLGIQSLCPAHQDQQTTPTSPHSQLQLDIDWCRSHVSTRYCVMVGSTRCTSVSVSTVYSVTCVLGSVEDTSNTGDINIVLASKGDCVKDSVIATFPGGVAYKRIVNYRQMFDQLVEYGVGGLGQEIDELYRRAFASRGVSDSMLNQLGITHVKGILLYGPPGTGKTLLARTIAKILGSQQVQLINGPEIISKYLGESEKNLRGYFTNAHESYAKHGSASELYVIIIDEIDAICKPRGKSDQSAAGIAYDSLVNQLLTLMDGLNEIGNTIVIGMTNRRELMDPALLRPGRFEVQIELKIPDEEGRLEIFQIHTRSMKSSSLLSDDVDLAGLAANTTGYSGAEIAGSVRAASSYALERQQSSTGSLESLKITNEDFQRALEAIPPANTQSESAISSQFLPPVFHHLGASHEKVITSLLELSRSFQHNSVNRIQTVLLYGPRGSGKTSLASQVAVIGQFHIIKIITASSLIGLPDIQKVDIIKMAFTAATKAKSSLIILDDLHRLLEYILFGAQVSVSHAMLHVVTTMLSTPPPRSSSILVIGTIVANSLHELTDEPSGLGLHSLFSWHYLVPPMTPGAVNELLNVKRILSLDSSGPLTIPSYIKSITIRQLLQSLECTAIIESAHSLSPTYVSPRKFNECLSSVMLTNNKRTVYTKDNTASFSE